MEVVVRGHPLLAGWAQGRVLISKLPISFWGGVDPKTGRIIDQRHDRCGEVVAERICVFPAERGSSTASAVLLELIRIGRAPAAIITLEIAPILLLGAMIAQQLYEKTVPVLRITESECFELREGEPVRILIDGTIERSRSEVDGTQSERMPGQ